MHLFNIFIIFVFYNHKCKLLHFNFQKYYFNKINDRDLRELIGYPLK